MPRKLAPTTQHTTAALRGGRARGATASTRIYLELRAELLALERRPGDAISEAEIASAHGVSRTPVREAILKLADEGLIEIFPQSGIFVSRIPLAALAEAIIIRKALEETTAGMAATSAAPSQLLSLRAIIERQREAAKARDHKAFNMADEAFHAAIADVAGYPGIWRMIQQVKIHVDRYRLLVLPQLSRLTEVITEHERLFAAIEAGDPERAKAAMAAHLERLRGDIAATQPIGSDAIA